MRFFNYTQNVLVLSGPANALNFNPRVVTAGFEAQYVMTTTAVSTSSDPAASPLPVLTINGWMLMQRKVTGGSVLYNGDWTAYRDGFGSATVNDNFWLGLETVYRLTQIANLKLRVEVTSLN